ncbi:MAG TPA: penicillin-binding transpeptidase domain-containing protein, partial [Ktedonobacterales bacterium]|nr:penicillin-binding transpeptidase domain-containing protein [Ktedonobacterales bacterium]
VAAYIAAVADNGVRMQERLVTSVTTSGGATLVSYPAKQLGTLPISADNLSVIQGALLDPLYSPNGTAYGDFNGFSFLVAGKTGTAQSNQQNPNGWFECYAPASPVSGPPVAPQIAVGTLVEFSSFGEQFALPVSRATMGAYLHVSGY